MHSQVHVLTALKPGGGLYCTQRVCAHASVALSLLMGAAVVRFLYRKKRGEKKALSKQTPW